MRTLLFVMFTAPCWAGSSLTLGTSTVSNSGVDARPGNGACRMEAFIHGVNAAPTNFHHSLGSNACGINWQWLPLSGEDVRIQLYYEHQTVGGDPCQINVASYLSAGFYIRFQIIPAGAGGTYTCQAWDIAGTRFSSETKSYSATSGAPSDGATLTGAGTAKNISWGYFKLFTTTVGLQARMPVHSENGNLLSWKFDSSLADSSGHGNNGSSGSPSYTSTPGQDLILGLVKTSPAPKWADRRTLRVGAANQLDASGSFSQADISATVSCDWVVTSTTPASGLTLTFDDATDHCTPTATPNAFGDYYTTVTLTNANMVTGTTAIHLGAANMSENGVIQPANPNVTQIFGPMIALGWNPWGLADEREVYAHSARRAAYQTVRDTAPSYTYANPEWEHAQAGTVEYRWNGTGNAFNPCTTLTGGITPTGLSISVANATCLDLSSLPTRINIQASSFSLQYEEIRICAASATSGPATLTVCYDGRGVDDANGIAGVLGAGTWNAGALVGQQLMKGTGTDFMGGAEKLCEAGAGPMGPLDYQTGTVGATAGSALLTGFGTTWNTTNKVNVGDAIRIEATHGGNPFIFVAYVASIDSTTQITMNRVFPADADTDSSNPGYTYQIIRAWYRLPVTSFTRATYGGSAWIVWGSSSCESDTQAFFSAGYIGHDVPSMNNYTSASASYTFLDYDSGYVNVSSTGGINFYGEDLAWYSLHFRSGLAEPKTTAEMLSNHWVRYPGLRGGVSGTVGSPLFLGSGVVGGIACLVVDSDCALSWADVRGFVGAGGKTYALTGTCSSADSRDGGYLGDWLAMGALFDPDTSMGGFREQWRSAMDEWERLELSCKGTDNSWSNNTYMNFGNSPSITLTNGSPIGVGTGLDPGVCLGIAKGTFTYNSVGSNLTAASGTFNSSSSYVNIVLNDASGIRVFTRLVYIDPTHVQLEAQWPGAATGTWMQLTGIGGELVGMTTWGVDANSTSLAQNYECIRDNANQITLERPWNDSTGVYKKYTQNLAGRGQQPYMLAIKTFGFSLAANLDSALGTDFANLRDLSATWVASTGYDAQTKGMRYGTNFQSCEVQLTGNTNSFWKQPGCSYGTSLNQVVAARMLNGESARAFVFNRTNNLTRGDEAYAALWCSSTYNDPALYPAIPACDANSPGDNLGASNLTNGSFNGGKWPGFFFGMGMAHQWPAARLLGSSAGTQRTTGNTTVNANMQ